MKQKMWILIVLSLLCSLAWSSDWASVGASSSPLESPIQPSPTPEDWAQPRHPGPEPEHEVPATPEPTSIWEEAGLWMGTYALLVNQHGAYCIPELAACG